MADKTRARLEEIAEGARAEGEVPTLVDSLADLAAYDLALGDTATAKKVLDEASSLATDPHPRLIGLGGMLSAESGRPAEAEKAFREVIALLDEGEQPAVVSDAYAGLGSALAEQGKLPKGLEAVEQAVDYAVAASDQRREMAHTGRMGVLFMSVADVDGAVASFTSAASLAEKLGDARAAAGYLNNLGLVYVDLGQHDRVIETYEQVAAEAEAIGDVRLQSTACFQLARDYHGRGMYQESHRWASAGLDLLDLNDPGRRGFVEICLESALHLESYAAVAASAEKELGSPDGISDRKWRLRLLGFKGDAEIGLGNLDVARSLFEQALPLATGDNNQIVEARIRGRLGAIYADMGEIEQSTRMLEEALATSRELQDHPSIAEQLVLLAMNEDQTGARGAAIEHVEEALDLYERLESAEAVQQARLFRDSMLEE